MLQVNTVQAKQYIVNCIRAQLTPMLVSSPGVGKSAVVHQVAGEYGLKVIDLRLSQCDPTDLLGLPSINRETGKAEYSPMDTFPLETDEIPEGYNGWMLFLDELNSAPLSVQAAAYKITNDRQVGMHKLHPNCAVAAAGNLETDNAIVNRMGTAMQSRLIHLELMVDHKAWQNWASENEIDHRVRAFIGFRPAQLHKFDPDHTDRTFACPRTWEYCSRLVSQFEEIDHSILPLLAGTISEGMAREFIGYCRVYKELPTIKDLVNKPGLIAVPSDPAMRYAISGCVSNHLNKDNAEALMEYIQRMPLEFQVISLGSAVKRDRKLTKVKGIRDWMRSNMKELF